MADLTAGAGQSVEGIQVDLMRDIDDDAVVSRISRQECLVLSGAMSHLERSHLRIASQRCSHSIEIWIWTLRFSRGCLCLLALQGLFHCLIVGSEGQSRIWELTLTGTRNDIWVVVEVKEHHHSAMCLGE